MTPLPTAPYALEYVLQGDVLMASRIGVRDLESRASEIVREVHEEETEFIVTLQGEPVAVLRPLHEKRERDLGEVDVEEVLAEADRLADRIAHAWRSPKSALDLLQEQRR